jgi:hypothetical protein
LCPLLPQMEHVTGDSSTSMNLLRLRIRFFWGRPACRLGDFGSFVLPSYSIVSIGYSVVADKRPRLDGRETMMHCCLYRTRQRLEEMYQAVQQTSPARWQGNDDALL